MTTLASVNDVSLALGGDTLFDGLSLEPDGGTVTTLPGVRVGFLPQEITSFPNAQVLTFVYDSVPGRPELRSELAGHEARLAELEHDSHANHDELVAVASGVPPASVRTASERRRARRLPPRTGAARTA